MSKTIAYETGVAPFLKHKYMTAIFMNIKIGYTIEYFFIFPILSWAVKKQLLNNINTLTIIMYLKNTSEYSGIWPNHKLSISGATKKIGIPSNSNKK